MAFLMKDDVTFALLKVAFFGAIGVVFSPNGIADYLKEHFRSIVHKKLPFSRGNNLCIPIKSGLSYQT